MGNNTCKIGSTTGVKLVVEPLKLSCVKFSIAMDEKKLGLLVLCVLKLDGYKITDKNYYRLGKYCIIHGILNHNLLPKWFSV